MIWWWSGKEHFVKQQCIAEKDQSTQNSRAEHSCWHEQAWRRLDH